MINQIRETLIKVCKSLNTHKVNYLIIGGVAVSVQGFPRYTADIDFWYDPKLSNFHNILEALENIGVDISSLREIVFDPEKTFLRIPNLGIRIEFLPTIPGLDSFQEAKKNATKVAFDGIEILVLGYDDLIKNKEALCRPNDIRDVEELKKRKLSGKD